MGQPEGGFPENCETSLKGKEPITCILANCWKTELPAIAKHLQDTYGLEGNGQEVISYALYPKDLEDYQKSLKKDGNFRYMGSDIFFVACVKEVDLTW